ncbi:PLD nuclease N-terminal domain-containing protein [Aeromicrobium sp. CF4.19]|uniref:PLD nuclease N-terminal domain-containing protein n=1 Tax=Aeromicrobium sp. CF4.19 TaxID=3373082 RepID=UPI003EE640C5
MGKALIVIVAVVLLVYAFFDLLATPATQVRVVPKLVWFVLVVMLPFLGPLLWIFFGAQRQRGTPPPRRRPGGFGPDDDPDYLRGL